MGGGGVLFTASFRQPPFLTPPLPPKPLEVISHLNVSHGIHKLHGSISTWDGNRKITVSLILFAKRWLRDFPLIHWSGSYSRRAAIFFRFLSAGDVAHACCFGKRTKCMFMSLVLLPRAESVRASIFGLTVRGGILCHSRQTRMTRKRGTGTFICHKTNGAIRHKQNHYNYDFRQMFEH